MSNIQVSYGSTLNDARSESVIAINPGNPAQMAGASRKCIDIAAYNFTTATVYSADGGNTWHDSAALALLPGWTGLSDPVLAWDDSGNVFLIGAAITDPPQIDYVGMAAYRSTDGGKTWSGPTVVHSSSQDEKGGAAGDHTSPLYHGRIYIAWNDGTNLRFARTLDHGATWIGLGTAPPGSVLTPYSYSPAISVVSSGDIYIVGVADNQINMLVSTDGGNSFSPVTPAATGISKLDALPPWKPGGWPVLPGGAFRVFTLPVVCAAGPLVLIAWPDYREGVSRIYYARSIDAGATWLTGPSGQPLLSTSVPSNFQHFHPQIVIDPNGVVACGFYEFGPKPSTELIDVIVSQSFDHGASFNYFIVTDRPWDPTIDAPISLVPPIATFIGDYFGLDASPLGFYPLWTDTRTGIQELWTAILPEKGLEFIIDQSTIGQDEVDTLRKTHGPNAVITDAFRVVVDGFTAAQLSASSPASTLTVPSPTAGMKVVCTGNSASSGGYGPGPQRFTFFYNLDFGTDTSDPAFAFSAPTEFLTLLVTVAGVSAAGRIELIKQPDPYMLHGDPSWLSIDLRVFPIRNGQTKFGQPMGDASTANNFIQQVAKALSNGNGTAGGQSFDDPTVLSPDEDGSALYLTPNDESNVPVFNFALARVRYIGLIGAPTVRVFFRLFSAQQTTGIYDYPPGEQYRRAATNPAGQPIPLAGVIAAEYVTIPCFALPRIDSTSVSMTSQTDSHIVGGVTLGNIQNITAHADGSEVDTFFGCWLDINQPFKADGVTPNRVLPARALAPLDGPFTNSGNPPQTVGQAIARNLHQCLIAEIAFDPTTIPFGTDPSNWDKLAQRNIAWSPVGSAQAVTTFEIRPTSVDQPAGQQPDELMIDWGTTPTGSVASIYLPAVTSGEILSMASRMYTSHGLTRADDHTVQCQTGGVTYLPIPPGSGSNYAGLLSIAVPNLLPRNQTHTVVVRQVTNAFANLRQASARSLAWRKVVGAFQLTIPVSQKNLLLLPAERQLSVLRWIAETIPAGARWYPVFQRYLEVLAGRVKTFGGDPAKILPSPLGNGVPGFPGHPGHPGHPEPCRHDHQSHTGKIDGIVYDHFGDFEAFILETRAGERHRFQSREPRVQSIVHRAWMSRILVTVTVRHDRPLEIVLHGPPPNHE